ncbi:MAG: DNA gyrase inhibitor YacG [Sphingomonas sp.]|uniref:DNA gyrase inhibitor YacG n=1 Tax=Sphingomonas sp. TaxID=28214 RepID=UPI001AC66089|nr:DNA gyrase inhibitor YacG [Sphingomonas sp.]MBN8808080.1 DNA gyrase inhibitor YacG [Sphingomonas sp.]
MSKTATCPLCGAPSQPAHKPFCSRGCRDRDLLKWLGEGYAIPGSPADPEALDRQESRD